LFRRAGQEPDVWITVIIFSVLNISWFSHMYKLLLQICHLQFIVPWWRYYVYNLSGICLAKQCRKDIDSHLYWKSACFHQAWFYFTLLPLIWNKLTARKEIDWNLHIKCNFLLENLREWAARMFVALTTAECWERGPAVIKDLNSVV